MEVRASIGHSIIAGAKEAIAWSDGKRIGARVHEVRRLKDSATMWAVIPGTAKTLSSTLGMLDNDDEDCLRLYGCSQSTLFRSRKEAKDASSVWPKSKVVPVVIQERGR